MYDTSGIAAMLKEIDSKFSLGNIKNANYMFSKCRNLVNIPSLDTSNVESMSNMFAYCVSLQKAPAMKVKWGEYIFNNCSSLIDISELDFTEADNIEKIFQACTSLANVPIKNLKNITRLQSAFINCNALTNESLNNIMASLLTLTSKYTQTKTLKYIGLSSAQATTCTTLSNWAALEAKGWSTGY
jgi:surface protein